MNSLGPTSAGMMAGQVGRLHVQQPFPIGTRMITVGGNQNPPPVRKAPPPQQQQPPPPGGKLMRLRCRFRPLHDAYIRQGNIVEEDTDVIFVCGDGHQLKAHKVIMASSSKFFAKLFEDQASATAVVSVPDIKVDIMKLVLQLTYRDRVILTMRQIKEVGEFITIFGMAWTQFGYEEYEGDEKMSSLPMPPIPMKKVELPRTIIYVPRTPALAQQQQQQQRQQGQNVASPHRLSTIHQNQQNGINNSSPPPGEFVYQHQQQGQAGQGSINAQQMSQMMQNAHAPRKTKLTPRAVIDGEEIVEQDEEEDPENKMRDWMARLGKRDSTSAGNPPNVQMVKKMRPDQQPAGNATEQQQQGQGPTQSGYTCSTCNGRFRSEMAWRWHEERHVGVNVYKCQFCDELVPNPKLCYIHEKEVHGYCGMKLAGAQAPQQQQQQQQQQATKEAPPQQQQQQRRVFVRSNQPNPRLGSVPTGLAAASKKVKMATFKKVQSQQVRKPNFMNKHPGIAIGESEGSQMVDAKKIKQLHWLYVCQQCDNCSDSVSKARLHYDRCYPKQEVEFEQSVVKHRQGFYGKSRCPLCSRRYPFNSGFMIHCGHQHQKYRRLFSHTGTQDDQINCVTCKNVFLEPISFHAHLVKNAQGLHCCGEEDINAKTGVEEEEAAPPAPPPPVQAQPPPPKPTPPAKKPVGRPKSTNAPRPKRVESPIESKASYKVQFHTPPKSARLANRAKAEASAEAAKAKKASLSFPPVDCPVCGEGDIPDISQHLQDKHEDLNIEVTRISSELLRCQHCTITFSNCDLLDHKNCFESKESADVEDEVVSDSGKGPTARRPSNAGVGRPIRQVVVDMDSLPPGVGRSPIERIEIDDLHSIQAIRSALECKVCGLKGKRLGAIADCLRAHGIQRCSLCFNSYCNKADYTSHLRKCHGAAGNKLKCPLCPKSFSNAGQTSGHMYSTHWLQILRENEASTKEAKAAAGKGKKGNAPASAPETDDAKSDKQDESVNGSSAEQSFEEGASANDDSKSGEDLVDGNGEEAEGKDPLAEEGKNGEGDTTMQVEGSSDHDEDEPELDIEDDADEA